MLKFQLSKKSKKQYISDYNSGIDFYIDFLMSLLGARYIWNGLPNTCDAYLLEEMLVREGAVVDYVDKNGNIWLQPLNAYGVGVYPDRPPHGIIANPILGSHTYSIEWFDSKGKAVCFENPTHYTPFLDVVRTAKKLSRTDSTTDIMMINNNGADIVLAQNERIKKAIDKVYEQRCEGKITVEVSNDIINVLGQSWALIGEKTANYTIKIPELMSAYNNQLRQFCQRMGIILPKDKSQAILTDESENDNTLPLYVLSQGLECRKKFVEKFNQVHNSNVTVEINQILIPHKGDNENVDNSKLDTTE